MPAKFASLILLALMATPLGAATFGQFTSPVTTNNDDTCDIGLYPAATLLLPYFEVDVDHADGETTIFTVTNTGPVPQAARVTLWTDFSYPVISFDLYLTGYDVQKVNLFDVIGRGFIAPDTTMGSESSPVGELSEDDNPQLRESTCANLPGRLPTPLIQRMQRAFREGVVPELGNEPRCVNAGGVHEFARGYATIDVVTACTGSLPTDRFYFSHEIRFDNVLMGDYVQVNMQKDFAQASPMVHIRAVGEGGDRTTRRKTRLPRTFYSHLQENGTADARQPLPAVFAARWIGGGGYAFETFFKIWRESLTTPETACRDFVTAAALTFDAVRFDENENPEADYDCTLCNPPIPVNFSLPSSSLTYEGDANVFPPNSEESVAGWMYINLHNYKSASVAGQGWVTTSMRSDDRFSVDIDGTALGNGCSAPAGRVTEGTIIGPAPNEKP